MAKWQYTDWTWAQNGCHHPILECEADSITQADAMFFEVFGFKVERAGHIHLQRIEEFTFEPHCKLLPFELWDGQEEYCLMKPTKLYRFNTKESSFWNKRTFTNDATPIDD